MKVVGTFPNGARIEIVPSPVGSGYWWTVIPPFIGHSRMRSDWAVKLGVAKYRAKEAAFTATEGKPGRWKWTEEPDS